MKISNSETGKVYLRGLPAFATSLLIKLIDNKAITTLLYLRKASQSMRQSGLIPHSPSQHISCFRMVVCVRTVVGEQLSRSYMSIGQAENWKLNTDDPDTVAVTTYGI